MSHAAQDIAQTRFWALTSREWVWVWVWQNGSKRPLLSTQMTKSRSQLVLEPSQAVHWVCSNRIPIITLLEYMTDIVPRRVKMHLWLFLPENAQLFCRKGPPAGGTPTQHLPKLLRFQSLYPHWNRKGKYKSMLLVIFLTHQPNHAPWDQGSPKCGQRGSWGAKFGSRGVFGPF